MIDAEAAGTSAIAARVVVPNPRPALTAGQQAMSVRTVRTWWKLLLNPLLRRFGWSFVSVVDTSTDSVLKHELRRYPDHCRVLDDPYRSRPRAPEQGREDLPIRLLNGKEIVLQLTSVHEAVHNGERWVEKKPGFWVKEGGSLDCPER